MNITQTSLDPPHIPVMLNEVIEACSPKNGGYYVDCTFGGGGYTEELLKFENTQVIAIDRDPEAVDRAKIIKKKFSNRFSFYNDKFSNIDNILKDKGAIVDTFIFDLGVSTYQLSDFSRGFSFNSKEKINMNMGLSEISAEETINNLDEKKLKLILKIFGNEKDASRISRNIIKERKSKKIILVPELVKIIEKSKKKSYKKKINVCTQTFQALRIFVNKEITELIEGITKATKYLKTGGKIIVVTFHSIEDKVVKYFFNHYSKDRPKTSRYFPDNKNYPILFDSKKHRLIKPSDREIQKNPKSRSAKLRFITRSNNKFKYPEDLKSKFKNYIDLENINV